MMKWTQLVWVCMALLISGHALANGNRCGLSVSMLNINKIHYDHSAVNSSSAMQYGLFFTTPIDINSNRWRWFFGFNYLTGDMDNSQNSLTQSVTSYELRFAPQYALATWGGLTPYVGAGMSLAYTQYADRYRVYDTTDLDDINQVEFRGLASLGVVFNMGNDPNSYFQITSQASYLLPVTSDSLGGLELKVAMSF